MLHQPFQKRNLPVPFAHQNVAKPVRESQRPQGSHRIDKERVRSIKGINVTGQAAYFHPARCLNRPGNFERELVEIFLLLILGNLSFVH